MATTTTKRWIGFAAAGAALIAATGGARFAVAQQTFTQTTPVPIKAAPESARVTLDARDVDIRLVYRALFDAYGQDYSLAPEVKGYVTLKLTEQPLPTTLESVARCSAVPLTVRQENQIWTVQPTGSEGVKPALALRAPKATTPGEYSNWKRVPRRVAAYIGVNGAAYALLVNGPESDPQAQVRLVQVGDYVPAGFTGHKPLRVTQISDKGVTLSLGSGKNDSLLVPIEQYGGTPPAQEPKY